MTKQILKKLTGPFRRVAKRIRNSFGPEPMQILDSANNLYVNAPGTAKQATEQAMEPIDAWWEKFTAEYSPDLIRQP